MDSKAIIRDIKHIYARFPVPRNLQEHMARVAGIASLICDHWTGPAVNRDDMLAYLLLHDLGNIVKFDFSQKELYPAVVVSELGLWKRRQEETIARYGSNDHDVTLAFAQQLGVPDRVRELLAHNDFFQVEEMRKSGDWENKIGKYADLRVGPFGVLSLKERLDDFRKRYAGKAQLKDPRLEQGIAAAFELEKDVLAHATLDGTDINDKAVSQYVQKFLG